jgi:hypothetical protein
MPVSSPTRHESLESDDSLERTVSRGGLLARVGTHTARARRIRWAPLAKSDYGRQQSGVRKRSWVARHPALFGTLVGFGTGFLIGYAAGDDGVFYDYTAGVNGLVLGGIGAGAGAAAGAVAGALAD